MQMYMYMQISILRIVLISQYLSIMRKFEQDLKEKAHLNKIKNAKRTVPAPNKNHNKNLASKNDQAQLLLTLYEKKRYDSIPAYKLLRTAGLQQYTKGFIERGYGVKLGSLSALSQRDKNKLYQDLKIMPGHAVKLDKLIETVSKHSYIDIDEELSSNFSNNNENNNGSKFNIEEQNGSIGSGRLLKNQEKTKYTDPEYDKELEKVLNEYTPMANQKKKQSKLQIYQEGGEVSSQKTAKQKEKISINFQKIKLLDQKQFENEKNIRNEYTPPGDLKDKKKRTFNDRIQKKTPVVSSGQPVRKYSKTKYVPNVKPSGQDFKKKPSLLNQNSVLDNKPTAKRIDNQKGKQASSISYQTSQKMKHLGIDQCQTQQSTSKIMDIHFQIEKFKSLNRSFDGSLMTSTIANIDIQQLVYAFSGYVHSNVSAAPQPTLVDEVLITNDPVTYEREEPEESIDDQVGNILRQSYLHPLYREDENIDENIENFDDETEDLVNSQGEQQQIKEGNQFLHVSKQENLKQSSVSSFLGGDSYDFGLEKPLNIFNEPNPTELDYFKPTIDSIANFIKNIVLTAKMQRQIPIMAAHYLQTFIRKTGIQFNSLNYKRILVTLLLLASKIWDDQSFQSPSFSKTFPQYQTILLNEMEKQVLKALDYKLKLDKREFAQIYFQLRKYARRNIKSFQNKKLNLQIIRELQVGIRKQYKSNVLTKRNSF